MRATGQASRVFVGRAFPIKEGTVAETAEPDYTSSLEEGSSSTCTPQEPLVRDIDAFTVRSNASIFHGTAKYLFLYACRGFALFPFSRHETAWFAASFPIPGRRAPAERTEMKERWAKEKE